jgi:uncharacterized membrane protein required for colicin V production
VIKLLRSTRAVKGLGIALLGCLAISSLLHGAIQELFATAGYLLICALASLLIAQELINRYST